MLIDFTVENYRSIKGPVTLSAIAQKGRNTENGTASGRRRMKTDEEIAPTFPVEGRGFELLPALGIFGANASGKSNVLSVLGILLTILRDGPQYPILPFCVPFRLTGSDIYSSTIFHLRVLIKTTVYNYELDIERQQIRFERLQRQFIGARRSHTLFTRQKDSSGVGSGSTAPELAKFFRGEALHNLWHSLSPSEPFLSLLLTRFRLKELEELGAWVRSCPPGTRPDSEFADDFQLQLELHPGGAWDSRIIKMVQRFDTAITGAELRQLATGQPSQVWVSHTTPNGPIWWPLREESVGTQRLFSLALKMLKVLDQGSLLLIDELGSNIHPNITQEIVRLFQGPKTNPKRAQLIFTSHDNTLQQRNLLRRDQIWFTQKRPDGSTELYPLTDFHPRNDLAIDKAYLDGRFGAVPLLPLDEEILPSLEAAH